MTDRPAYSFEPGPPPEASRFLANKDMQPAFSWRDVEPEEHAVAFSVAKAMQLDVLRDIRDEVQAALDQGLPFAEFQRRLRPRLQARGWWGRGWMTDPLTGEAEIVQLGSPRRLRVIYNANLRSARAAGQWERIQRTRRALPYLEYRLGPSENHRPHHEAKAGMILPVDDPFWQTWYPPNGWNCRCWVRQLTRRQAEARGISPSPEVATVERVNRRTGEVRQVPVGIDPGWERNPGALRQQAMERLLEDRLTAVPEAVARAATRDIATSWRAERLLAGTATGTVPVAVLSPELSQAVGSGTRVVQLRDDVAAKLRRKHPEVDVSTLGAMADAIYEGPAAIEREGGRTSLHVYSPGAFPVRMVIKVLPDANELWISTLHAARPAQWRSLLRRPGVRVIRAGEGE